MCVSLCTIESVMNLKRDGQTQKELEGINKDGNHGRQCVHV